MTTNTSDQIAASAEIAIKESVSKIVEIAQSVDAANLLVAMFANMAIGPAEHIRESTHGTVPAKLELLAYHLYPLFGVSKETDVTPWHTQACWEALDRLLISQMHYRSFSHKKKGSPDHIDYLLNSVRNQTEVVRGSAYPEQTAEEIISVQGAFDAWFVSRTGIAPTRAVDLLWAIVKTQEEKVNDIMPDVLKEMRQSGDMWADVKKTHPNKRTEIQQAMLKICPKKKNAEIFGYVKRLNELSPLNIPVGRSDLKFISPIPSDQEWKGLCDLIGLTAESRKKISESIHVRQRPLFILPDNRALLADISNAFDCLWERYEQIAKDDQVFYDKKYQRKKADWLELKVATILKLIFPSTNVYRNLSYPDPDKSEGSTTELDFAVLWPPFLVLVEAKARQFRIESQLGDPGRLRSDIKANIEDAYEQAKRALRYISNADRPEFREIGTGRKLAFDKREIYRTYLLTVSQHHLAGLVNQFAELQGLGLFKSGEYPLSICLADLETISEFCGPDVFLHFIEKRIEILHESVRFNADELDFFGAYLTCRLRAERLWKQGGKRLDWVSLGGWHEKFDGLMEYKRGERVEPPLIELEVPPSIKDILLELRRRPNDPGARWIAFTLLAMSDAALDAISKAIGEVRSAVLTPGMFRRVSFQDGDTVISIVAALDLPAEMLRERTKLRVVLEKYRRKALKSIGIGIMVANKARPIDCATWVEGPWQYDQDLEKALDVEPDIAPARGQKLPGRNEPCICGSGKKFKKCCLPRIGERTLN